MAIDSSDEVEQALFNVTSDNLDVVPPSQALLEQYKLYVENIDRVSDRRQTANSFFLSLNTGICVLMGYILSKDTAPELRSLHLVLPFAGILLAYYWHRLVASYRQLNSGKFTILHLLEKHLPAAPYRAEWVALGSGKDPALYTPLTHLEIWIPRLFMLMYISLALYWLPWPFLFSLIKMH